MQNEDFFRGTLLGWEEREQCCRKKMRQVLVSYHSTTTDIEMSFVEFVFTDSVSLSIIRYELNY